MAHKRCHYDVLQVSRSASPEQIAEAYRKLAKQYHPDWNPDDPTTSEQFKRVTKAYDVLSDPKRRAKYDEKLARRARAANTASGPPPVQEENTSRTDPPHAEPHAQAEQPPAGDATHQTATQSVSILRSWIIALKHFLLRLLSFSSKSLGDARFSFALVVFILAVVAIPASYFVMTYQTPDSEVRSLLARAEVKMQLGDLDEATQLVREATYIEGANNLSAAKKLLDAIAAQQEALAKAEAEQKAKQIAERKAKEEAEKKRTAAADRKAAAEAAQRKKERRATEQARREVARKEQEHREKQRIERATEDLQQKVDQSIDKAERLKYSPDRALEVLRECLIAVNAAQVPPQLKQYYKQRLRSVAADIRHRAANQEAMQKKEEEEATDSERTTTVTYHENGLKKEEVHLKNGKQDGPQTMWDENGQKSSQWHYKNGKLDGLSTLRHNNGEKRKEVHYKDGELDGLVTEFYENGKKYEETHYDGGQKTRMHRWHSNGQKQWEIHYKNGEQDGLSIGWDKLGKKVYERQFKDGELISEKEF